jgi:hypothetical protein
MYDGRTILHLAAADNDLKLCKRLVADGIDVNCLMKTSSVNKQVICILFSDFDENNFFGKRRNEIVFFLLF